MLLTQANWMKGFSAECLGQAALAVSYYREAIALAEMAGRHPRMAQRVALPSVYSRTHLARVLLHMGFPDQSMKLIRESNELARRNRFPISFADAVLHAIYFHVMHGHAPEGFELASTLAAFSREHALHYYDALGSVLRGVLLPGQRQAAGGASLVGTLTAAQVCFLRSISVARAQGTRWLELRATNELHRLNCQRGRPEESIGLLRKLYESFTEGWELADLRAAREMLGLPASTLSEESTVEVSFPVDARSPK